MSGREPLASLREVTAVSSTILALLALIALIAVVEKGPPLIAVYRGASPFNTGPIGTFELVEVLRENYPQTVTIRSYEELDQLFRGAERCLFITVSPEVSYTSDDAWRVVEKLRTCKYPAVLIADEGTTSNPLLEAMRSSMRVSGRLLRDPLTGTPYVNAFVKLPTNSEYVIVLDRASDVTAPPTSVIGVTGWGEPVMALEEVDGVRIAVVGDGSILLNQVLASNTTSYREMVVELVKYLCGSGDCRIAVDGSKYDSIEVGGDLRQPSKEVTLYVDPLTLAALTVLRLIHPATWFPWLISWFNSIVEFVKGLAYVAPLLVLASMFFAYKYVTGRIPTVSDSKLEEQKEVELYLTGELRDSVMKGKISLDRQDFLKLFELVDSAVRLTYGRGLCDPEALKVLPLGDGGSKYVRDMCRLYDKASGRKRLPIVLSWNRTTKKMIARSEEFLKAMGQSLTKEKGVEYLLLR